MRWAVGSALLLVIGLALSACGDDSPAATTTTPSPATSIESTTTTSEAATTSTAEPSDLPCPDAAVPAGGGVRFVFCGGLLIARPSVVVLSDHPDPESRLGAFVDELVAGLIDDDASFGVWSSFGHSEVGVTVALEPDGSVVVDFDERVADLIGPSPSGDVVDSLTLQIWATLFQFEEVTSVTLTLDGDCERLGALIMSGCPIVDRDLWSLLADGNRRLADPVYADPTASLGFIGEVNVDGTRAPYTDEELQSFDEFGPLLWHLVTTASGTDDIPHGPNHEWVQWGWNWAGHQPDDGPHDVYGVVDLSAVDLDELAAGIPVGTTIVLRQVRWSKDQLSGFAQELYSGAPENGICSTGSGLEPNKVRITATTPTPDLGGVPADAVWLDEVYGDGCPELIQESELLPGTTVVP